MRIYSISDSMKVPKLSRHFRKPSHMVKTLLWIFMIMGFLIFGLQFYLNPTNSLLEINILKVIHSIDKKRITPSLHLENIRTSSPRPVKSPLKRPHDKIQDRTFKTDLTTSQVASGNLVIAQDDPRLVKYIRKHHLTPPPTKGTANFSASTNVKYTEQQEVFRYVINVLGKKTKGFFIECGANDGEYFSNTVHLELDYQWTGLLVEPDPRPLPRLIKRNRKAWIADVCLSTNSKPKKITMMAHKEELLSFVPGFRNFGSPLGFKEFKAQCFPLYSILKAIKVTEVDYFSLDIEGAELPVLKTIPWDSVFIKVLSIEVHAKYINPVRDYMTSVGYKYLTFIKNKYSHDQIYVHPNVTIYV